MRSNDPRDNEAPYVAVARLERGSDKAANISTLARKESFLRVKKRERDRKRRMLIVEIVNNYNYTPTNCTVHVASNTNRALYT